MIPSRGLNLLKNVCKISESKIAATNLQSVRLGHSFMYRTRGEPEKRWLYAAEAFGVFMWWWFLWHMWHDFGHLVGEFPYPDIFKWTNEELGIPSDDYKTVN